MPPPPGIYTATFTVNGTPHGFDVRTNGYGEETTANMSIVPIPWSQAYAIVVQSGGSNPVTRRYRAMVYTEDDYLLLRGQRGEVGQLQTAKEPPNTAVLTACSRSDMQDPTVPLGAQTIEVTFTMLS